jgi:hypothetical protein
MQRIRIILVCFALCISGTGSAEKVLAPVSVKTVQLSKIVLKPDIPKEKQHVKVGTICLFSGAPVNFGSAERTVNYEHYERIFTSTMNKKGFKVLAKSSDLFEGEGAGAHPDFLVGATFRPTTVDICDSVDGQKGKISISIEWQIYDREKQKVVEVVTTDGTGQLLKFQQEGLAAMIDEAFSAGIGTLVDQDVIQKYLGKPTV